MGYEDFVDNLGGNHKIRLYLGVITMHIRVFSLGQSTEWGIFWGVAKISKIFMGHLKIPIFVWAKVDAGPDLTYEEKMRVTPPGTCDHLYVTSIRF